MTLSPVVAKCAETYEQKYGCKPDEVVLQIAEHIAKVGRKLRESGKAEASEGYKPRHSESFETLVHKAFHLEPDEDPELVETIADIWQAYYMDGYGGEKEVSECLTE